MIIIQGILVLCIGSLPVGRGLYCLECQDVTQPRHCHYVKKCPPGYSCMVQKFSSLNRENLYNAACTINEKCSSTDATSTKNETKPGRSEHRPIRVDCQECCNGDICNSAGCGEIGFPETRGPVCFNCPQSRYPDLCESIKVCNKGELCRISSEEEFGDIVYTTRCESPDICKILEGSPTIVGKRSNSCMRCCSTDLCNNNCNGGHTSTNMTDNYPSTTHKPEKHTFTSKDHMGTEFIFAIPANYHSQVNIIHIYVLSTENEFSGTVTTPYRDFVHHFSTTSGSATISLPTYLMLKEEKSRKAIEIRTSKPTSVYAFDHYRGTSGEGFIVYPRKNLGYEYIVSSRKPYQYAFLVVTGTVNDTQVKVTIRSSHSVSFSGRSYYNGQTIVMSVNDKDTIQIFSSSDLSGTRVVSSNPIAVISGNKCFDTASTGCSQLAEYLIPLNKCGSRYILPPMTGFNRTLKIFPVFPDSNMTAIHIYGTNRLENHSLIHTYVLELPSTASEVLAVISNQPVCLFISPFLGKGSYASAFLTQVPSLEQYANAIVIPKPTFESFNNYISVVVPTDSLPNMRVDNSTIRTGIQNITVGKISYSSFWMPLSKIPSKHYIESVSSYDAFGVIAYGEINDESYGYPATILF